MDQNSSSCREIRNIKERDRRMQMKSLLYNLAPLVHPHPSQLSAPQVLLQATNYVKQLQERIEKLKRLKEKVHYENSSSSSASSSRYPVVDIRVMDSIVEVNLVTGFNNNNFMSHQLIHLFQEEGANVISFSYHNVGDHTIIYTIRSQAISARIGMEISSIRKRLKELVH